MSFFKYIQSSPIFDFSNANFEYKGNPLLEMSRPQSRVQPFQLSEFDVKSSSIIKKLTICEEEELGKREISTFNLSFEEIEIEQPRQSRFIYCTCQKSKCNKLYCECFANGRGCSDDCGCSNCKNCCDQKDALDSQKKAEFKGCNCRRSKCSKKYCECFVRGQECTALCKCVSCENCQDVLLNSTQESELRMNDDLTGIQEQLHEIKSVEINRISLSKINSFNIIVKRKDSISWNLGRVY